MVRGILFTMLIWSLVCVAMVYDITHDVTSVYFDKVNTALSQALEGRH